MTVSLLGGVGLSLLTLPPLVWLTVLLSIVIVDMVATARGVSGEDFAVQVKEDPLVAITLICVTLTGIGIVASVASILSENITIVS